MVFAQVVGHRRRLRDADAVHHESHRAAFAGNLELGAAVGHESHATRAEGEKVGRNRHAVRFGQSPLNIVGPEVWTADPQAFRPDGRQSCGTSMRRMHSLAVVVPPEPPPEAGHLIRGFRLQIGLTGEELAHALGISFSTVSRWENGRMKPSRLAWQGLHQLAAENGWPLLVESSEDARERRIVSQRPTTRGSA